MHITSKFVQLLLFLAHNLDGNKKYDSFFDWIFFKKLIRLAWQHLTLDLPQPAGKQVILSLGMARFSWSVTVKGL